jgi:UDP-N-acetyl-D-glucosamine dehydrogenase
MADLAERVRTGEAVVGIIGMGYVGLPLARTFHEAGLGVLAVDIDPEKVEALEAGRTYLEHIPSEVIAGMRDAGRFSATTDFARLAETDAILICVPTPLSRTREPDLSFVARTAEAIVPHLKPGHLVVLESTTYPGTTREVLAGILERSGLAAGKDFHLAFSPEREDPGNTEFATGRIPKLVGGLDEASLEAACTLYGSAFETIVPVSSMEVAEAAKLTENIYRAVNIALVNELKVIFARMGIDVWEVLEAAGTKPFGYGRRENKTFFTPGPGLGGHCIPIDPFYLAWKAREFGVATRFIELAGEINTSMPDYVVQRVMVALNDRGKALRGARVLVLGLAYKPDVDDVRESPSVAIIERLRALGAEVAYNDPHVPQTPPMRQHDLRMESVALDEAALESADAVLVATNHSAYDWGWIVRHSRLVVDTRNACRDVAEGRERIVKA